MHEKTQQIERFRHQSLEMATNPQLDLAEYFDLDEGYENISQNADSSIYETNTGIAVAFRLGPRMDDTENENIHLSDLGNGGSWLHGPPSSVGKGVLLANDPRCFHYEMMGRMNPSEKDIYVVSLMKSTSELHFGSKEDEHLGIRSLGALAANASALSPGEMPYLQGGLVNLMQSRNKNDVMVFKEKLYPAAVNNSVFKNRWLLAKGDSIDSSRIVGRLK